jgi:hypothetical protein
MKKIVMFIGLLAIAVSTVFGQVSVEGKTYYYKYVETVDSDTGVRSKGSDKGMYITFTRNSCYESDEKGIKKGSRVYNYQKEENNRFTFLYRDLQYGQLTVHSTTYVYGPYGMMPKPTSDTTKVVTRDYRQFLSFSKDYKKISISVYWGKTETSGLISFGVDITTPGKAAYWEKGVEIWEQSAPPPPPETEEQRRRREEAAIKPPVVEF